MLKLIKSSILFCSLSFFGQSNSEVFLLEIESSENEFVVLDLQNISNNKEYDNQPYFTKEALLFAGSESGQTDIISYDLNTKITKRVNNPTPGGEYSPQIIPNNNGYAAVRLDTTGLQGLYHYDHNGNSKLLVNDLQVAYYAFYDESTILTSVLSEGRLDLVLVDLKRNISDTLLLNSGRSIHKIPGNSGMSYTSVNEEGNLEIFQLDIDSKQSYFITQLPIGVQDYTWIDDSRLIIGSNESLFLYDLFGVGEWTKIADLSKYNIKNITRLAANPDEKKLALVAEPIE